MIRTLAILAICCGVVSPVSALQVKVFPEGSIYVFDANRDHGYVDLVIHNILFVNDSGRRIDIQGATVEVLQGQTIIQTRVLTTDEIRRTTSEIAQNGRLPTAQLDTDFPWSFLAATKLSVGSGSRLGGFQVAAIKNVYLTVQGNPTSVRIRAVARNPKQVVAAVTCRIAHGSTNRYASPVKGVWYMRSIPNITSHHRWNAQTEFAVDFFKMGENGLPWKTDGRSATDFYGFGSPVLATADGVVVAVENSAVQNYDVRLQKAGETDQEYDRRLTAYNTEMMKVDPYKAMIGNFVVIRHANGEYSSYAHLKSGSVTVQKEQHVTAGQQIAAIGDTGDTNLVHLHFEIMDGPDPLTSRSIPFTFQDLRPEGGDLGRIVRSVPIVQ